MVNGSPCVRVQHVRPVQLLLIVLIALAVPVTAAAQDDNPSRWGVKASFVKNWKMSDQVKDLLSEDENETVDFKGDEFEIGFVRGSQFGGDWGVSFVKKPFTDGPLITSNDQDCFNQAQTICTPRTEVTNGVGVVLTGVEVHWFIRIVNIAQRVQVGVNVAGGVAQTSGQVLRVTDSSQPTGFTNQGVPTGYRPVHEEELLEAKDELLPIFPLFKLEAVGSVILHPHAKIQFAYGLNFPAQSPRVMGVFLF